MPPTRESVIYWHNVNVCRYHWMKHPLYKKNEEIVHKAHDYIRKNGIDITRNGKIYTVNLSGENGWSFVLHIDGFKKGMDGYAVIPEAFLQAQGKLDEAKNTYLKDK